MIVQSEREAKQSVMNEGNVSDDRRSNAKGDGGVNSLR